MDLVRLSAAGGFACMAMLAVAASASGGRADTLFVEATPEPSSERIQARIDDAFRASGPPATFGITGPLFPNQGGVPTRPVSTPARPPWPLGGASVHAWSRYIDEASRRFGVPADWVRGVMARESGGRTHLDGQPITSSAGAMGLMQLMPGTFAEMSARHGLGPDPYDPRANILAGTAYLRAMYDRYGPAHFLAAYNAGPARVDAHLRTGRALPGETRAYTAALQPLLVPGAVAVAFSAPSGVRDLTSLEAIRALTTPASRSGSWRGVDPANAPVIAAPNAAPATPHRQPDAAPADSLFVTLTGADRRREASAGERGED